ncbi:hypothetical protein GGS20DRAFT_515177 [Poronia punctata]|nr:hypothetical protein GGS20DRAFT_515177 [Poronia punctata]
MSSSKAKTLITRAIKTTKNHLQQQPALLIRPISLSSQSQSQSKKTDDVTASKPTTSTKESTATTQTSTTTTKEDHKKSMAELDDDLMKKMSGISGDGGEAGVEYEDGKPVAMKRGVRNNMFRYI